MAIARVQCQRQAAHRQYKFRSRRFEQLLQDGNSHARNSAHVMTLVCSHTDSSCPGCWHTMRFLAISEDLSTYLLVRDRPCFVQ